MKAISLIFYRIFLFLAVAFILMAGQGASAWEKSPLLVIEKGQVNAGTVVEGFEIRHTFLLQNRGDAPLIISKAETDCSCTQMQHDDIIDPLSNSYFRVVFHTLGQTGDQVKNIRLTTNDPVCPEQVLTISAHVLPAVKVEPNRLFFKGPLGSSQSHTVTISSPDGSPFELAVTENQLPGHIKVNITKSRGGQTYTLAFTCEGSKTGISRGRLFLKTDIPHRPMILIPVMSRILPAMTIIPEQIDFARQNLDLYRRTITRDPVRTLNLRSADGTPPKLLSLETEDALFKTRVTSLPELGVTRIEISAMIREFTAGIYKGELVVKFENKETLTIPVRVEAY